MKNTSTSVRFLPALLAGGCLALTLGFTAPTHASDVRPVNTQVAWWHGGYGYGPAYYGPGFRGGMYYNRGMCDRRCWRNSWGRIRCASRCW